MGQTLSTEQCPVKLWICSNKSVEQSLSTSVVLVLVLFSSFAMLQPPRLILKSHTAPIRVLSMHVVFQIFSMTPCVIHVRYIPEMGRVCWHRVCCATCDGILSVTDTL